MKKLLQRQCCRGALRVMRILCFQVFLATLLASLVYAHDISGQGVMDQRVSLRIDNAPLKTVLALIERKAEVKFAYSPSHIDEAELVSSHASNEKLSDVLDQLLGPLGISYKEIAGRISLYEASESNGARLPDIELPVTYLVSGQVFDENAYPLPGVNVIEKGTLNGTATDANGRFSLRVADENSVLVVSFIGYTAQEVPVLGRQQFEIVLEPDTRQLEEVVVVGYGTQKKVNLTGAVETIAGDRLENRPVANVSQMLQGLAPGLNMSIAGNFGFEPGAEMGIQIRGQGSVNGGEAFVVIDGVPGDLNTLNPNDIESISVLKDAAASAIYGARAPYGVILVTTKTGKKNEKLTVSYNGNVSLARPIRLPDMVDSYTYARAINEAGRNGGGLSYSEETIDRIRAYQNDPSLPETVPNPSNPTRWGDLNLSNANYDWFDLYYGDAIRHQQNLAVQGGSEKATYYVSAGYVNDNGVITFGNDFYNRYNLNGKVSLDIADWANLSFRSRYQKSQRVRPNFDNQGGYELLFHQIARTMPSQALRSPNGYYTRQSKVPWTQDAGQDEWEKHEVWQTVATQLSPVKGLTFNADFSFRLQSELFTSKNFTAYEDLVDGTLVPIPSTLPSSIIESHSNDLYYTSNVYASYDFNLTKKNHFTFLLGYQFESDKDRWLYGRRNDLMTSRVPSISTATGDILVEDRLGHWGTEGVFSRLRYDYDERYLLEINTRYDGTSRFSEGNRYGFFPSLSAGWNIAREAFWQPLAPAIDMFKPRVSWGRLGNQNVAPYQDLPLIGINNNLPWIIDGVRPLYATAPGLISADLTWETSQTFDIGLDAALFQSKLNVTFDWYERLTTRMLGPAEALPAAIGADQPKKNNATLRNRGWELSLGWTDHISDDLQYSVNAMMADNQGTITRYYNPTQILTTYYEGMKQGEIWGYQSEGLFQSEEEINSHADQSFLFGDWKPGDVKYTDLNDDGRIDKGQNTVSEPGDQRIIGNTTPRYHFGLSLGAQYKNFSLSMFWQGVGKRDLALGGNMFYGFNTWNQSTLFPDHLDYYRDEEATEYVGLGVNTDAFYPRPYLNNERNKNQHTQSRYLQNGAYARLKNVQLRYTLSEDLSERIGMGRAAVYFSGENLVTLTSLPSGFDPETAIDADGWGHGKSHLAQAVFALGLELQF